MTNNTEKSSDSTYLLEEGMIINDKWEILNFIAKGGKGEVYLARQLNLDRQIALKIMSMEFIKSLEDDEEEISSEIMRFRREVKLMARMQHPNILQVYDFDKLEINGIEMDYIVMEYIPGPTLRLKMPEDGFGYNENKVKKWLKQYFFPILDGMQAVHDKGIVHRDMKPENILIDDGLPKIMDFGVAGGYNMDNVTRAHHMLGTINYMPEEQFLDLALTDARVDIYALGKILYELIQGKIKKGRDKPFLSVGLDKPDTGFFKSMDQIIRQATADKRNNRTPSVKSLKNSLEELVNDFEIQGGKATTGSDGKQRKYFFVAGLVIIIVFSAVMVIYYNPEKLMYSSNDSIKQAEITSHAGDSLILSQEFNFKNPQPTMIPGKGSTGHLPDKLLASDNMIMILLKGNKVLIPLDDPNIIEKKQIKKNVYVKSLYMDKTKISNHLYVQFLNEADSIRVKNKSVLRKGQLLLLLGEVKEGYEPILFKAGKFIAKPDDVSKPVVRVSPMGALEYARFYGKSLPTMEQWWLAVTTVENQKSQSYAYSVDQSHSAIMNKMMESDNSEPETSSILQNKVIGPVNQTDAAGYIIQGLGLNVNEWTMIILPDGRPQYHIHGGVGEPGHRESYLERQPWEAFSNVGFRTVLNIEGKK